MQDWLVLGASGTPSWFYAIAFAVIIALLVIMKWVSR